MSIWDLIERTIFELSFRHEISLILSYNVTNIHIGWGNSRIVCVDPRITI